MQPFEWLILKSRLTYCPTCKIATESIDGRNVRSCKACGKLKGIIDGVKDYGKH